MVTVFFFPTGQPETQKEAEQKHKRISSEAGSCNDFTMLLNVFEKCKARWVKFLLLEHFENSSVFNLSTGLMFPFSIFRLATVHLPGAEITGSIGGLWNLRSVLSLNLERSSTDWNRYLPTTWFCLPLRHDAVLRTYLCTYTVYLVAGSDWEGEVGWQ